MTRNDLECARNDLEWVRFALECYGAESIGVTPTADFRGFGMPFAMQPGTGNREQGTGKVGTAWVGVTPTGAEGSRCVPPALA
jgi:hypothetical protein